ncbi:hypothetical protein BDV36DRAFT_249823 [Aspergillus pseudocaelatus]|uniref:Zn(2)-C6 fungal-type domain-containing protein n=1 Tax=Aspergillus pseudocaelatus TaxID=1825620 RepID=A0ABQ6WTJ0_9EURO|nr:hypothetical protein BDV36DRAFT_249823 [Aspergillus pseudocaelatus]
MPEINHAPRGGRNRSACDLCRHRKIRCDRAQPSCENCLLARVSCTFTVKPTEARKSIRQRLSETQRQVQNLESLITNSDSASRGPEQASTHNNYSAQAHFHDTAGFENALSTFQQHLEYSWPGGDRSSHRASFCSAIFHHTGSHFDLDNFFRQVTDSYQSRYGIEEKKQATSQWPDKRLVRNCIEYYDRKGLYSVFPIVDIRVVREIFDAGVLDDPSKASPVANKACLVAFTALIAQLHRHSPMFAHAKPDAYVRAVLSLLPDLFMEEADVRTLETFIILTIYIPPTGQSYPAEMMLAAAVRILYKLGGHRQNNPDGDQGTHNHYHIRSLFWLSYWMDKEMSLRACREPMINDASCDLELPSTYVSQSSTYQFLQAPLSSDILLYPSDLRLALIKSKIYRLLHSDSGRAHPESTRMQRILELDQELSALESSFPAHCQPHVFATPDCPLYAFHDLSMRGVTLHLDYYYCVKRIHEASAACSTQYSFSSGMGLSHQTSRCMLLYINQVKSFITWHSFWIYAQWLLSAVISLFYHCMSNPTSPTFSGDLEILENTRDIFSSLMRSTEEGKCIAPFYITEAFVDTLIRFAKQSYMKATAI